VKSSILPVCTSDGIHPMLGAASCSLDWLGVVGAAPWPISSFITDFTHVGGSCVNAWEPSAAFATNGGEFPTPTAGSDQGNGEGAVCFQGNGGAVVWFRKGIVHGMGAMLPSSVKLEMGPGLDTLEMGPRFEKLESGSRLDMLEIGANVSGGNVGNKVACVVVFVLDVVLVSVKVLEVWVAVVWVTVTVVVIVVVLDVRVVMVDVVAVAVVPVVVLVVE